MVSQLQEVKSVDLYYICQVVDNVVRSSWSYARNVEDIFGDASSTILVRPFPHCTNFHIFVESIICSLAWEQAGDRGDVVGGGLWVDHLFRANGMSMCFNGAYDGGKVKSVGDYFEYISEEGHLSGLAEKVARQVFFVLFANRRTLSNFSKMISYYVSEVAPTFEPTAFTSRGSLRRTHIPSWVRSAVFHRDKGRCAACKTDLTGVYSQLNSKHFDHILPLANGGANCITNMQLLCSTCNLRKGSNRIETSYEYEAWYDYR